MSLLVGCSKHLKSLTGPKARSKPLKSTQKFGGKRANSNQAGGDFPGLHDDNLSKASRSSFTDHLDPRTVSRTVKNIKSLCALKNMRF